MMAAIHHSPLAGSWYPSDACELRELLGAALESSVKRTGPYARPGGIAFIAPHAAPAYSGTVASSVYRHVRAAGATRVIVLGFSHRRPVAGIGVPDVERIETPLGDIPVDRAVAGALVGVPPFHSVAERMVCDHSVEIQIPYLQTFVPDAAIVPLYVGELTDEQRHAAAALLRNQLDARTVLIASSDLTHYGRDFGYLPFRVDEFTAEALNNLDTGVLAAAGSLDPTLFRRQLRKTGATVCGSGPIALLLETVAGLSGETFQETLDYETSGEIERDYRHSVSYGALGYFPAKAWQLEPADQATLLASARFSLDHFRRTGDPRFQEHPGDPALQQRGRAFVTLYTAGRLRGCIGRFENPLPLAGIVPRLTLDSLSDERFEPPREYEELEIEVHILTPPKRIVDVRRLRPGEHGALLKAGPNEGLLLPVVAARHHLSGAEFLRALALKAEVSENVYSGGDWELSIFRDQSFRERPA